MEKGRAVSPHSVLNGFSQWHPVAPDLKADGRRQQWWVTKELGWARGPLCFYPALNVYEEQASLWLLIVQGEEGMAPV